MRGKVIFALSSLTILTVLSLSIILADKALHWRSERDALNDSASVTNQTVAGNPLVVMFIGDSIVKSFPVKTMFPRSIFMINKGVNGNMIEQIKERYIKELRTTNHEAVVFEGGINNILGALIHKYDPDVTEKNIMSTYRDVIELAKSAQKKIVVVSILPVTHKFLLPHTRAIPLPTPFEVNRANEFINKVNAQLARLCADEHVTYVDIHSSVQNLAGEFQRSLAAADGYHVNVFGYQVMADALTPSLVGMHKAQQGEYLRFSEADHRK